MAIGLYSLGPVSLPHPPYKKETLRVIERGIAEAWRIICDEPQGGFQIALADEDRITSELRVCLINRVLYGGIVPGFTSDRFRITRDSKFESYDGSRRDLMPDFHIDVVRDFPPSLPSADGLFVECKPIDRDHPAGGAYCDKGIIRFVEGEYAWAMAQGLMVGYARTGYALPKKLQDALDERKSALKLNGRLMGCPDCAAEGYAQQPHVTIHRRGFTYPSTNTKAPEITIRHPWLDRN